MGTNESRLSGVIAAGAGLGIAELVAGALGSRSVFGAVADAAIAATPGPIVRLAIGIFGSANRLVLLIVMSVVILAVGAWVGRRADNALAPVAVFGGFALLAVAAGLADPSIATLPAVLAPVAGGAAGLGALRLLRSAASVTDEPATPVEARAVDDSSRRRFLAVGAGTAGLAVAAAVAGRSLTRAPAGVATDGQLPAPTRTLPPPEPGMSFAVEGLSPLITPNDQFFRIDTAFTIPRIDADTHEVRVTGLVDRPLTLSYAQLADMADTEADVTLACVSNEVGGDLVGNARWQGVPLTRLFDEAGVQHGATQVVGRSVDGWTSGFPVEVVRDGRPGLVAVAMNGEPLPRKHGFPVRLVVAGLYGYVCNTKWLEQIELTTFEAHDAYWVPRGWAERAPIKLQSRIDVPGSRPIAAGTATIAGVAWSDGRGISRVEVAVDDGQWRECELADELATTTWRQWRTSWDATAGDHTLRVRAFDADGQPQTEARSAPAPDGATGHHTIRVSVA